MNLEKITDLVALILDDPEYEVRIAEAVAMEIAKVTIPPIIARAQAEGAKREKMERHENAAPPDNAPHANPEGPRQPGNAGGR